jgi:hypothetical protein
MHVYRYRKTQAKEGRFQEFYFLCFQWFDRQESWKLHAAEHLRPNRCFGPLLLKCNLTQFRHNLIRPAPCPECLGDEDVKSEDRFYQYTNVIEWKTHVLHHLGLGEQGPRRGRHPRCRKSEELYDLDRRIYHFADIHQISFRIAEREQAARDLTSRPDIETKTSEEASTSIYFKKRD